MFDTIVCIGRRARWRGGCTWTERVELESSAASEVGAREERQRGAFCASERSGERAGKMRR